jgi:hypothetical protein
MAARTIVTSHPDVACDVCGRRLLRGEQPETFLGGGQRRLVCELCTTRAAHEGWRRESEARASRPPAERPARGGALLRRLRQLREPARPVRANVPGADAPAASDAAAAAWTSIDAEWAAVDEEWGMPAADGPAHQPSGRTPSESAAADRADAGMRRALEIFNAGEHPCRLAGVARALGAPTVRATALPGAHVAVVVAWELCWYRYEIDPDEESRGAWLAAEGMELDELAAEERIANAALDERGAISLLAT